MKGTIIANEFNRMVWVNDENGTQYSCYADNPDKVRNDNLKLTTRDHRILTT